MPNEFPYDGGRMETFPPTGTDKDRPLAETVGEFESFWARAGLGFRDSRIVQRTQHGWSAHLDHPEFPGMTVNGKGSSRDAALASAYGELLERLVCGFLTEGTLTADRTPPGPLLENAPLPPIMTDTLPAEFASRSVYEDPDRPNIPGVPVLPMVSDGKQEEIMMPRIYVNVRCGSNGAAAGNTLREARVQALCEIMERQVMKTVFQDGTVLPGVPDTLPRSCPACASIIDDLRQHGYTVELLDASLNGTFPVVAALLHRPGTPEVSLRFGAHPRPDIALCRALTETLQGQAPEDPLPGRITFTEGAAASPQNRIDHYQDGSGVVDWRLLTPRGTGTLWPAVHSRKAEWSFLRQICLRQGKPIYTADWTAGPFSVTQLYVPGWSEVYPPDYLAETGPLRSYRTYLLDWLTGRDFRPDHLLEAAELLARPGWESAVTTAGLSAAAAPWPTLSWNEWLGDLYLINGRPEEAAVLFQAVLCSSPAAPAARRCHALESYITADHTRPDETARRVWARLYGEDISHITAELTAGRLPETWRASGAAALTRQRDFQHQTTALAARLPGRHNV